MMHSVVTILIVTLTVVKSANNLHSLTHSSVVEVTCILFSSFYECSDNFNKTDDVYNRYNDVCINISLGARYLHKKCTRSTMKEIVKYFEKQTMPANGHNNVTKWRHLKKNPKKIVNFVMSTMLSNKVYKRTIRKIHQAIQNVKIELRAGSTPLTKVPNLTDDLILEFSCSVFSVARYCSHQLDHCHNRCLLLERVCTRLSFGSQLLSLSCNKDTIPAIMSLLHSNRGNVLSNEESIWKEIITQSPMTYIDRLTKSLNFTQYSFQRPRKEMVSRVNNNGTRLNDGVHALFLFVLLVISMSYESS